MKQIPVGRLWSRRALERLRERHFPLLLCLLGCFVGCRAGPSERSSSAASEGTSAALADRAHAAAPLPDASAGASAAVASWELSWRFAKGPFGPTEVVISVPAAASPDTRFPVLVAFHGREQTIRDSKRGARAWLDDYRLPRALERLSQPPLGEADFAGLVAPERLARLNAVLHAEPYAGLIVVCPFVPDVLGGEDGFEAGRALADFIVDRVLPRVYARTPARAEAAATGVDGVSLGGRAALLVGLSRPRAFGSVGSLQAALGPDEVQRFAQLGARALQENPALQLRLVTSAEDAMAPANQALSSALTQLGARQTLLLARGGHGPEFTRGPGALEMLLFHGRVLRGLSPP